NANPLTLVAAAQHYPNDNYYHAPKPHKNLTTSSRHTSSTSSYAPTKNKGKEVAKSITPPSPSTSEEDIDPEQAQRDKDMNDRQTRQFGNQRTVTVAGARETIGNQVVQQTRIQCFNFKEYGHFAKEYMKLKRVKDYSYHKEKMMLCKQEEKGVPLSAEQSDWLHDTDEEPDEQELEAHYMYIEKIEEVLHVTDDNSKPTYDTEPLEHVQTDNEYNVFVKDRQHSKQPKTINDTYNADDNDEDERVELTNLISNLKLDIDENKKIQKQLRKSNATLTHELNERKYVITDSNDVRDRCGSALHQKEVELEKYTTYTNWQLEKEEIKRKYKETLDLLAQQKHQSHEALKTQAYETF
ncbi:hypothetical protein Tco_1026988, partial [Tanacetum coccineum]